MSSFTGTVGLTDSTGTISPSTSSAFSAGTRTESVTITQSSSDVRITATSGAVNSPSNALEGPDDFADDEWQFCIWSSYRECNDHAGAYE